MSGAGACADGWLPGGPERKPKFSDSSPTVSPNGCYSEPTTSPPFPWTLTPSPPLPTAAPPTAAATPLSAVGCPGGPAWKPVLAVDCREARRGNLHLAAPTDPTVPSEDVIIPGAPTGERPTAATGSEDYLLLKLTLMARLVPWRSLKPYCP